MAAMNRRVIIVVVLSGAAACADGGAGRLENDNPLRPTSDPGDRGAFKTPGRRDVSKRAPYMHDGSLPTLRAVVEFYNRGGVPDAPHSGRIVPLRLAEAQIDELVAFLQSLDGEGYQDQPPKYFPR
jgi:cytochrome c peroxidase